jgi:glycerol uptake facilitator-like aquaporin
VSLGRALAAEALGTAFLLATVVGSGIMGERLADGNAAIALLANSIATGAALTTLIMVFGPVSGAHFNPVVTLAAVLSKTIDRRVAAAYVGVQFAAAFAGAAAAHAMFGEPLFFASFKERAGAGLWWSEIVATFGLLVTIFGCMRNRPDAVPVAVGLYICAAYWFTSSTSFANPAVTLARAASDTFAGIRPVDVPAFIAAQLLGALLAVFFARWIFGGRVMKL